MTDNINFTNVDKFRVDNGGGLFVRSQVGIGQIPLEGSGDRLMWHPYKSAFRAGSVNGTQWNDFNIGFYSWAGGLGTIAYGTASFAFGEETFAAGETAIAMGNVAKAIGSSAIALGDRVTASGNRSIAIGHAASSNFFTGSMVLGDGSTNDSVKNSANNQFIARYAGGYRLFSNSAATVGVVLAPGGNSWFSVSDSAKKENFLAADLESFLQKLKNLRLGSWNYKMQDANQYRHYGPMAQEIFSAYGRDAFGTIGCDTLLASADMDGIMMILLKGLESRTAELKDKQVKLEETLIKLEVENELLRKEIALLAKKAKSKTLSNNF